MDPGPRSRSRFDAAALAEGRYVVAEALELGPGAVAGIAAGEQLVAVDGDPLGPRVALERLLAGRVGERCA